MSDLSDICHKFLTYKSFALINDSAVYLKFSLPDAKIFYIYCLFYLSIKSVMHESNKEYRVQKVASHFLASLQKHV